MELSLIVVLFSCWLALIPIVMICGLGTPYAHPTKVRGRLGRLLEF